MLRKLCHRKGMTLIGLLVIIIAIVLFFAAAQTLMVKFAFSLLTSRLVLGIMTIACIAYVIGKAFKK